MLPVYWAILLAHFKGHIITLTSYYHSKILLLTVERGI